MTAPIGYGRPVGIALRPESREKLEQLAELAGMSLTAFCRHILESYLMHFPEERTTTCHSQPKS